MGPTETLLALALLLLILDVFLVTEITTVIAYILVATALVQNLEISIIYQLIIGSSLFGILLLLHFAVWRKTLQNFMNTEVAPDIFVSGQERLIGKKGVIVTLDSSVMVRIEDELVPVINEGKNFSENDEVIVEGVIDGNCKISLL
jgi:membrane protein implicated in regulation of membrane protease activity